MLDLSEQLDHLAVIRAKIHNKESILKEVSTWRLKNRKIVFTNGCFDLLHLGHVEYLSKASDYGNALIVGINSDNSVRSLGKANNRPIQDEHSRAMIIASLHVVDAVVIFDEETPENLISLIRPDVLVKGSDYKVEEIAGHDIVQASGGEVKLVDLTPGYSTSAIEKKIRENFTESNRV